MTAKQILLATLIILTVKSTSAQITFQKTFGGITDDQALFVQQTYDDGYIIVGCTDNFGAGNGDVYLVKTDAYGDTLWTKTFGGTSHDCGYWVQQTKDRGYIIAAYTRSLGAGNRDAYLIKTDSIGDTLWTKTYGGTSDDWGLSVNQTADEGYILTGLTYSFGAGDADVYLIKTDTIGDTLWTKTFGGTSIDEGFSVQQTSDGGYIIAGVTGSFSSAINHIYLIKTDATGDTLWTKIFGGVNYDYGYSVQQTVDGGYIIAGITLSFGAGGDDAYLIKTDSAGNVLWSKTFGGTNYDYAYSVQQTTDGGYIISGSTTSFGAGIHDVYLIKTDAIGDTLWTKTFGGTNEDYGYSVQQTADRGYIIAGWTYSFGVGNDDVYLIKTDSLGNSSCNEGNPETIVGSPITVVTNPATLVTSPATIVTAPTIFVRNGGVVRTLCTTVSISKIQNQQNSITIYPNPFINELKLGNTKENGEVALYDVAGKEILRQSTVEAETTLNTATILSGFYILHYLEGSRVENIKLTKM